MGSKNASSVLRSPPSIVFVKAGRNVLDHELCDAPAPVDGQAEVGQRRVGVRSDDLDRVQLVVGQAGVRVRCRPLALFVFIDASL